MFETKTENGDFYVTDRCMFFVFYLKLYKLPDNLK